MASSRNYRLIFSEWLDALRNGDWGSAETFVADDVIVNGSSTAGQAYIQELKDDNFQTARLDLCIVDDERAELAARFVFPPRSPESPLLDEGKEWTAQTFFSFANDKISAIQALAGANNSAGPEPNHGDGEVNQDPALLRKTLKTEDLRKFYTEYIDSINARTMRDRVDEFCPGVVVHNYFSYVQRQYRGLIESSFDEISGLRFTVERLIVNEEAQQVAARLTFTGVPTKNFRGIAPTGKPVSFSEHAFYQLEEGRIRQVWSLLDLAAYRASIAP
ncbi:SnoaL-like polyketide cyclase [Beauveria bassiana ARSEF 2860]|uniref:SnoaL-like polyketide cyclase n=1 Tax=Beauveria bassiana (strain ARSEF 2860) TaxID=655819 RepID=J4W759_BEAB2|nr:SnoaL-like polyketide cyclase [Beauveria bassiana ARSEF 2860]EJP66115.1 SnoaL-like polyketide cyclase [Beauveria bassiana ARSEF 2860]